MGGQLFTRLRLGPVTVAERSTGDRLPPSRAHAATVEGERVGAAP